MCQLVTLLVSTCRGLRGLSRLAAQRIDALLQPRDGHIESGAGLDQCGSGIEECLVLHGLFTSTAGQGQPLLSERKCIVCFAE
jgi:hypothetical protein